MNDIKKEIQMDMRDMMPFIAERLASGERVTISGGGKSMYPFIDENKDKVVLMCLGDRPIRAGEIYLYCRADGRYSIHRAYSVEGDSVTMLGDGQWTLERGIPKSSVMAVVAEVIRPEGTVDCLKGGFARRGAAKMHSRIFVRRVRSGLGRRIRAFFSIFGKKDDG